jgi:DNA-binding MarR family transcriptional regulator
VILPRGASARRVFTPTQEHATLRAIRMRSPSNDDLKGDEDSSLDLDSQCCFALYTSSRLVAREHKALLEEFDLTYPRYLVMLVLWQWSRLNFEHSTVSNLGQRLDLDSGTLTPLLRRLEEKGYVSRNRSGDDEREVFVQLTSKGQKLRAQAQGVSPALLKRLSMPKRKLIPLRDHLRRLRDDLGTEET